MDILSLPFIVFQVASPKQWATWVYLLSSFKWQVLHNGQLESTFYCVSSGKCNSPIFFRYFIFNYFMCVYICSYV